ncbi:MAG: hypothetical protein H0W25_15385 [Acidimicrobiia bacterium]|nr:hypothetical protein [Acidimicrobiia bacterium]
MFVCDCPSCGRRELRGSRSLFSIPAPAGPILVSACRACATQVPLVQPATTGPTPAPAKVPATLAA